MRLVMLQCGALIQPPDCSRGQGDKQDNTNQQQANQPAYSESNNYEQKYQESGEANDEKSHFKVTQPSEAFL